MSDEEIRVEIDDAVVIPMRATGTDAAMPRRGPGRHRMTPEGIQKATLEQLQSEEIKRLAELPEGKHLGPMARLAAMKMVCGMVIGTGTFKPKTLSEATKAAEVAHRIALAEEARIGAQGIDDPDDRAKALLELAEKARAKVFENKG